MLPSLAVPAGYQVATLERIDSTNLELKRRAVAGAADGLVVTAREQSAGRGRQGRTWISPPGNLYFSLLLRPDAPPAVVPQFTFVAALAVADAVAQILGSNAAVRCKWPNDVLVRGRKVAGILLESAIAGSSRVEWLIVGIGVNLLSHPPDAEVIYPASDLASEGTPIPQPAAVLARCLEAFDRWRRLWQGQGFTPVREAWRDRAYGLGRPVTIRLEEETVTGVFVDLDESGAMRLATDHGNRLITAGDVCPTPQPPGSRD
jgi:BirA family biotin operon repressor/biotin-[acetyl-CoA-carboxylase] ligase